MGPLVDCQVAALNLSPLDTYKYPPEVLWEIDQNSQKDHLELASDINTDNDITGVIIQHEYGIFGGKEGEILLSFMEKCSKPMLVTLHTVLPTPSPKMKSVTQRIIQLASTVVVLTESSKKIIETLYPASVGKVFMIPHGIHPVGFSASKKYKEKLELEDHLVLSTFGLLSRGKGIEYVLHALPEVIKKYPSILYLILGETHPVIRRQEGEKYRVELARLITKLDLQEHVRFYDQYFGLPDLFEFLKATDIYVSTSTNPNQAVSGTLSYALGTGRAVVSTQFAQAKELVNEANGRLVPIKDSPAITSALLDLLNDQKRLVKMHHNAYQSTRSMLWNKVASDYLALLGRMIVPTLNLDHLIQMTDDVGLFQFAKLGTPDKKFGYTLDDNARALIVSSWLFKNTSTPELESLMRVYLAFIKRCQLPDGSFVNYLSLNQEPTAQNTTEDLEDCQTRAMWALAEIMNCDALSEEIHKEATTMFLKNFKLHSPLHHLRAKAFLIKAYALVLPLLPELQTELMGAITEYAQSLSAALTKNSNADWQWFEDTLNYNNALLSESLLIAGNVLKNKSYTDDGLLSLRFLISKTFGTTYMPIGHKAWYKNKGERSYYDQQPEDPASMILALSSAYHYTGEEEYKTLAKKCFSWFLGNNSLKVALYDPESGGCYDGLHPDRVNRNQGAESLISYLMARVMITGLN